MKLSQYFRKPGLGLVVSSFVILVVNQGIRYAILSGTVLIVGQEMARGDNAPVNPPSTNPCDYVTCQSGQDCVIDSSGQPCCESYPPFSDWSCCQQPFVIVGSGTLSSLSETTCPGVSVGFPSFSGEVDCGGGIACQTRTRSCGGIDTHEWAESYDVSSYWEPANDPSSYSTPGTHVFTAKRKCVGGNLCNSESPAVSVGNFTVYTVGVGSLQSDQGSNPSGLTNFVCWASSGVVTVTAAPTPSIPANDLPSCWNMSGGTYVSKTVQTVPKSAPGFYRIIASAGTSAKTQVIAVVKVSIGSTPNNIYAFCDHTIPDYPLSASVTPSTPGTFTWSVHPSDRGTITPSTGSAVSIKAKDANHVSAAENDVDINVAFQPAGAGGDCPADSKHLTVRKPWRVNQVPPVNYTTPPANPLNAVEASITYDVDDYLCLEQVVTIVGFPATEAVSGAGVCVIYQGNDTVHAGGFIYDTQKWKLLCGVFTVTQEINCDCAHIKYSITTVQHPGESPRWTLDYVEQPGSNICP